MKYSITEFKEWPKGLETSYHDWVIKASKTEIEKKLGIKPHFNRSRYKSTYTWKLNLDNGKYFFIIYDMSYGRFLGKDEVTEYHIGFDDTYDDIHTFFPVKSEACEMLEALIERELKVDHSELWKKFHDNSIFLGYFLFIMCNISLSPPVWRLMSFGYEN